MKAIVGWLALALALTAGACELPTGSGLVSNGSGFSVRAEPGGLVLTNGSDVAVHFAALEEETAARADLFFDPAQWPSVAPRSEKRVPFAEVMGHHSKARRAVVFWWTVRASGNLRVEVR